MAVNIKHYKGNTVSRYSIETNSDGNNQIVDKLLSKFLSMEEIYLDLNRHYMDKIKYREENKRLKEDLSHRIDILEKKVRELEDGI